MEYSKQIVLKDGRTAILRHGVEADGSAVFENFNLTHGETDYLLSYPDENSFTAEQEGKFLKRKAESANEVEIIALVDGRVVATAGIDAIGAKYKLRHRAEFGISVERAYWTLGIGRALTLGCIELAKQAGYSQLELDVVGENRRAMALYESVGFREYGRNPRGFRGKNGWQELVLMRLELDGE